MQIYICVCLRGCIYLYVYIYSHTVWAKCLTITYIYIYSHMLVRLSYFIVFETCSQRVCSTAAAVIHYFILLYCYVILNLNRYQPKIIFSLDCDGSACCVWLLLCCIKSPIIFIASQVCVFLFLKFYFAGLPKINDRSSFCSLR